MPQPARLRPWFLPLGLVSLLFLLVVGCAGRASSDSAAPPLLLTPAERAADTAGGTWSALFPADGPGAVAPFPVWVLLAGLLGLIGAPLTYRLLPGLPDRGFGLSRTAAFLFVAWGSWLPVAQGWATSTRREIGLVLLLLAALAAAVAWLGRRDWLAWLHANRRVVLLEEVVFWGGFGLWLLVRAGNPDLWHPVHGGEKPMDLAYLTAAVKSTTFPPYDPWFAGGSLNYYYFGQVAVGALVKLTGTPPSTAYNLALPLLYGLTLSGAGSAGFNLASRLLRGEGRAGSTAPLAGGFLAALGVGLLGNLAGGFDLLYRAATGALALPIDWYWGPTRVISDIVQGQLVDTIDEFPFFSFLYGDLHAHVIALPLTLLALGWAIGQIPGTPAALPGSAGEHGGTRVGGLKSARRAGSGNVGGLKSARRDGTATEVADDGGAAVPAPMVGVLPLALPMRVGGTLLSLPAEPGPGAAASAAPSSATSVAVPSLRADFSPPTPFDAQSPQPARLHPVAGQLATSAVQVAFGALAVGALAAANAWDFPSYLAIMLGALGLGVVAPGAGRGERLERVVAGVALVVLAVGAYGPFWLRFRSFYQGAAPMPYRTPLGEYLAIHGLFLFVVLSVLAVLGWRAMAHDRFGRLLRLMVGRWQQLPRVLALFGRFGTGHAPAPPVGLVALVVALAVAVVLMLGSSPVIGLLGGVLALTLALVPSCWRRPEWLFALGVVAFGAALGVFCELFAVDGDIGRMNTVFKFYFQVWTLWACLAGAGAAWLWATTRGAGRDAWLGAGAVLLVLAFAYVPVATAGRMQERFVALPPTLDGEAYLRAAVHTVDGVRFDLRDDLAAIEWLRGHVIGSPVILEGHGPLYEWTSRYSVYTGLPTVIGWDWHQMQQRWGVREQVDERTADVRLMYTVPMPEARLALLHRYGVRYVVVGAFERALYPEPALAGFAPLVAAGAMRVVYDASGVRIYEVVG